jgi:hypothetical protein
MHDVYWKAANENRPFVVRMKLSTVWIFVFILAVVIFFIGGYEDLIEFQ